MKMSMIRYWKLLVLLAVAIPNVSVAQVESTIKMCQSNMDDSYVSDGQYYTVLLNKDDIADLM